MTTPTGVKAQELMIGNYLNYRNSTNTIIYKQVNWHVIQLAIEEPDRFNKRFSPIPLTEQWLKDLGFEQNWSHKNLYHKERFRYQIKRRYMAILRPCDKDGESQANACGYPFFTDQIPCEYVHQLQNLYFALTATSITRTEDERK